MPRLKYRVPSYCLHKASGQAVVTIGGRDIYLGKHGTPESLEEYQRLIAECTAASHLGAVVPAPGTSSRNDLRVSELVSAYLEYADQYYRKNGEPTGEATNVEHAVRPLVKLYGKTLAAEFGPKSLKVVRQAMIDEKLSRKVTNSRVNRIRRVFKWGVENQLIVPSVLQALQAVAPLKKGRTEARETDPVRPVPEPYVSAVLKRVTRPVAAMIEVQQLTGMRPGEVVLMRGCDLDMNGRIWTYTPASHKTEHHGIERLIYLGPKAQEVIRPFLKRDLTAYLFDPREALEAARERQRRRAQDSAAMRRSKRKAKPRKRPGKHYTSASFGYAIRKACKVAGIPSWGPNRLRHNAATFLRKQYGIEAARVILGHTSAAITEVYAEMDRAKAAAIMAEVG